MRPGLAVGLNDVPPAAGGVVMGTAIFSTALDDDRLAPASTTMLGIALAAWVGLAAVFGLRLLHDRARLREQAELPAALTGVAATAVLGTRLEHAGAGWAGWAALVLAVPLWIAVLARLLPRWPRPTDGASFLLVVATESLATLLSALGGPVAADAALALGLAGLIAYVWVLRDFDWTEIGRGAGDHWVAGGALAIVALTGAELARADTLTGVRALLGNLDAVLFVLALAWLPVLAGGELVRPRLGFDVRRWATVFPLGMYAAAGFAVAGVRSVAWPRAFAEAWLWVAAVVWALVAIATVHRCVRSAHVAASRAGET